MKTRFFAYLLVALSMLMPTGCTDLTETPYDIITQDKFLQTKENVLQSFVRPFGHGYWLCARTMYLFGELASDHYMTVQREEHWYNGGEFFRLHYHTWTIEDWYVHYTWDDIYRGIILCNASIADISKIDPVQYGFTQQEVDDFIAQLQVLRAWMYMTLFDLVHNIAIVTDYPTSELPEQSTPEQTFAFIEQELLDALPKLSKKEGNQGNGTSQGLWNQGGAAALLARLYMNASWWIEKDMTAQCEKYCEDIINGVYGNYGIADRWDAPFDWDNENCEEIIYAFPTSYGGAHWAYDYELHWQVAPFKSSPYFGFTDWGNCNPKYALQPGLDLNGNEYSFENGKPVRKFLKYPDDVRLKKYRNLGNSKREGMFLYGDLPYTESDGTVKYVRSDNDAYQLYIRDQVGVFQDTDPSNPSPDPSSGKETPASTMAYGDQNSGWCLIKYPIYRSDDAGKIESDYAVIRLAEIYYYLAEIKFKKGEKDKAEKLLNDVRKRYYPTGSSSLYPEDGSLITEQELLDEWGREFVGEGQRRRVLCRFGIFNSGTWWDKTPDADNHTMWVPLSRSVLSSNPNLKQNPGYPDIER